MEYFPAYSAVPCGSFVQVTVLQPILKLRVASGQLDCLPLHILEYHLGLILPLRSVERRNKVRFEGRNFDLRGRTGTSIRDIRGQVFKLLPLSPPKLLDLDDVVIAPFLGSGGEKFADAQGFKAFRD